MSSSESGDSPPKNIVVESNRNIPDWSQSPENSTEKGGNITKSITGIDRLKIFGRFADETFTADVLEIISAHIDDHSVADCQRIIRKAIDEHQGDPCLPNSYLEMLKELIDGPTADQSEEDWNTTVKLEAFLIRDWSIYAEVRAVTRPIDEDSCQNYETIRVYLVSIFWSCAGSALATFFALRFPSIGLSTIALQILIAYTGKLFRYIPGFSFPIGFGRRCHFGGGSWSFKEQMLAACGMGVGNSDPYAQMTVISLANENFYGFKPVQGNFGFIFLLTLSTNIMGFGLAGLFRVMLVYPVRMIWFGSLPEIRLSRLLVTENEHRENVHGFRLKSYEFFWTFVIVFFSWFWVTDFLFRFLSTFDWVAWIAPDNNIVKSIFGVQTGLGFNPIPSLDPSIFMPSAMVTPFYSTICIMTGMFFSFFIILGLWLSNKSYTAYLPINNNLLYSRFGTEYKVSEVLDDELNFDPAKYLTYSMPYWTAAHMVAYGTFFAFYPAMIVNYILNHSGVLVFSLKVLFNSIRNPRLALDSFDDRFSRAQRKYKEVPEWWYILFLCSCIGLGIAFVEHYSFVNTPVWTIFFGIGLSLLFIVPSGVLFATTNNSVLINVLYELVIGLVIEGNGTALMVSKAFATNFMVGADTFISNLKQAHYVGLAPRAMFRIQIINCICNSLIQSKIMSWQTVPGSIPDLCDIEAQKNGSRFTCAGVRTYFTAAVQWGTIGPRKVFTEVYPHLKWAFLIGVAYPIPFWILRKFILQEARRRKWGYRKEGASRFRNMGFVRRVIGFEWSNSFNELLILSGMLNWAPSNLMHYLPWLYIGAFFQWYLPKYKPRWWTKYNYLLYAAITVGTTYGGLVVFFSTQYKHKVSIEWWGNKEAVKLRSGPLIPVPEGGFGPHTWSA